MLPSTVRYVANKKKEASGSLNKSDKKNKSGENARFLHSQPVSKANVANK